MAGLFTSDVFFFLSWCECSFSSEHCFKVSLRSAVLSIDQSSAAPFLSGKYESKSQFPSVLLCMSWLRVPDNFPSIYIEDSPLNDAFSSMHNFLIVGHGASDLHSR